VTINTLSFFLLCFFGFVAAWVDSIAGGGGIISIPAFLMAGLPPHLALGTNKLSASFSSITSSFKYFKSGKTDFKLLKILIPFTFLGSIVGVRLILSINNVILHYVFSLLILCVGVYSIFAPSLGQKNLYNESPKKYSIFIGIVFSFLLGFYDGFFGPGTGSFLMFSLMKTFGFDYIHASGNARVLNFISNVTSLITFILHGKVLFLIGLPVGICMIGGSWLGSHMAIKNGNKIVKPIFAVVTISVAVKLVIDLL
jgi:uncharacterized membrane protein YfcA